MLRKYRLLRDSGIVVFDRKSVANILGLRYASTNPVLDRLVRSGVLRRLRRDRYVLPETIPEKSCKIANELVKPSCISLWTALSNAGMTTQVPREVQSVTTKRATLIEGEELPSFRYVHLPENLFFGFTPDEGGTFRSDPEKALLDLLYAQRGRVDWESIAVGEFDRTRLRTYAQRFPLWIRRALPMRLFGYE
jgi:predicted transcriptional regulator of viral defense system